MTSNNTDMKSGKAKPIVNFDYFNELTGGSEDLRQQLIDLFEKENRSQIDLIRAAYTANDWNTLTMAIHKYRSSLFSVGILSVAEKFKTFEFELKNNQWPALD